MTILLSILGSYWRQIFIATVISICFYTGYDYIWQKGYNAAHTECVEQFDKYNASIDSKINNLEALSSELIKVQGKNAVIMGKSLDAILAVSKEKTLISIAKDGKCTLTQDFFDSYNSLILRGNQK